MKRHQRGARFGLKYWSEQHPIPWAMSQRYVPANTWLRLEVYRFVGRSSIATLNWGNGLNIPVKLGDDRT